MDETKEIHNEWKRTIVELNDGIDFLSSYINTIKKDNHISYLHDNSIGYLKDVLNKTNYPTAAFVPEFSVKNSLYIGEEKIKIHIVGYDESFNKDIEVIKEKYKQKFIIHKDGKSFEKYLEEHSGFDLN
ncbi:hypothetical protein [Metabacillus litoralis]|uniref:hypothetical protein n=1 Tax=Metabacillus litoralis TaxID=152268 RepID=UPI000EF60EBF|nr:hypothetical protein [Metabacillus litoralis]